MSSRAAHAATIAVFTAAITVSWPGSPAAAAGSAGYCPDASGVTVVVDFHELGGGAVVRCASGSQATGLAALKNAGFEITGTLRWGEGFICRIDGKPSAASEKCVDTPPASAYWSYWHAANGGGWAYSDKGVLNRKPPAGSFEGWSFSLNRNASDAPPAGDHPETAGPHTSVTGVADPTGGRRRAVRATARRRGQPGRPTGRWSRSDHRRASRRHAGHRPGGHGDTRRVGGGALDIGVGGDTRRCHRLIGRYGRRSGGDRGRLLRQRRRWAAAGHDRRGSPAGRARRGRRGHRPATAYRRPR
ncbi:hypothetical protein GA0070623_0586 [Micromonospora rifamycinica]|uniref:Flagellar hook-length control protein FliK n=1 Tax=Micromonospora rifamycinica TaxID=291594 RepID=A0A1C5H115_9ACTN|nr:hypothetical protein GA0070623_0586 [Micromonospora rifamycinica]